MADIYYETADGEVLCFDENSQRLLVYLLLHGKTSLEDATDPVGVDKKSDLERRVRESLGSEGAGLVTRESTQTTFGDRPAIQHYHLTEKGREFVYDHRERLAMPADLAELANDVASLQVWQSEVEGIDGRVSMIEDRLCKIEEQLDISD